MTALQVKPADTHGYYDLLLDGEKVGEVRKVIQTYNLRRYLVSTTWDVRVDGGDWDRGHNLRRDAVAEAARQLGVPA